MAAKFLSITLLLVSLGWAVVAVADPVADPFADPLWDPSIDLNDTNPLAESALKVGLYCLDHDGQILTAGNVACAAQEIESKLPVQLAINGKLFWTPQGDSDYRRAWQTFKTIAPNNPAKFRKDASRPLAFNNTRCSSGLCIHTNGKAKAYVCFESKQSLRLRKALGRLKSYATDYDAHQPKR